jgi:hypothetical protein
MLLLKAFAIALALADFVELGGSGSLTTNRPFCGS